jgi:ABC-2 type transport system ATP-binding protein
MNAPAILIKDLSYKYPGEKSSSIHHINLDITKGKRFGLFGPNGAGKTTLISCMTGLFKDYEGELSILGEAHHSVELKKKIGFVPQDFAFYHELTSSENLDFFGAMYGLPKTAINSRKEELCGILNLNAVIRKPLYQLSGGMKRRLNLAIALLHEPALLFLDEPTVGVDIQTRQEIISYLKKINSAGCTLIYTSHQLSEAEELCDEVAFIANGEILAKDSLENLRIAHAERDLENLFVKITGTASGAHV